MTGKTILNIDSEMVTLQDKDTEAIIDGYYTKDVIIRDRRPILDIYTEQMVREKTGRLILNIGGHTWSVPIYDKDSSEIARSVLNIVEKKLGSSSSYLGNQIPQ